MSAAPQAGNSRSLRRAVIAWAMAHLINPVVALVLASPAHGLLDRWLLVLTYQGRRTGRSRSLVVMHAPWRDRQVVLVGHHLRKTWWRNFDERPLAATALLGGRRRAVEVRRLELGDPDFVRARAAYEHRFGDAGLSPDAPVVVLSPRP